nr:M23 family metallopeptidase [Akkermansiaceae bacterium]
MIPFRQTDAAVRGEPGAWRMLAHALPRAYALVFYSADARFGWVLLLVSLCVPWVGLAGLAGAAAAALLGRGLGVDRDWLWSGFALFNPMLACSAVVLAGMAGGWAPGVVVLLWAAAAAVSLALTVGLQGWLGNALGLSVQSLPAVAVVVLLNWAGAATPARVAVAATPEWLQAGLPMLPEWLRAFFAAFGGMVFHPGEVAGLLVYAALVVSSPLGAGMATAGLAGGGAALWLLGWPLNPGGTSWCGFGFLLAGIALGAGYHLPNRASMALAAAGGALVAVAAVGLWLAMSWFGQVPGALPYNLVVLALMIGVRWLAAPRGLVRSPWSTLPPEDGARVAQVNALRFPHFHLPALCLPWTGSRVVTQGFDGGLTHRGLWTHALDLEAPGGCGSWGGGGGDLREFAIFGTPVHSPVAGFVVAVENSVADNPPGGNNPEDNWGNHVVIRADAGFHVMLAHFQQGTVVVAQGQRVEVGSPLGTCGNSGRSPVPHLHLQVQDGPARGAPTRPFVLKHYIQPDPDNGRECYHLSGVPPQGALLRPVAPCASLLEEFRGWLPGRRVFRDGRGGGDSVVMDFDEQGRFRLHSETHGGELTLFLAEGVLYAEPFTGKSGGVL